MSSRWTAWSAFYYNLEREQFLFTVGHESKNLLTLLLIVDIMAEEPSAKDIVYERITDPAWLTGQGGPGEWSTGLCDCFSDCRLCIISIVPVLDTFNVAQTVRLASWRLCNRCRALAESICGKYVIRVHVLTYLLYMLPVRCIVGQGGPHR